MKYILGICLILLLSSCGARMEEGSEIYSVHNYSNRGYKYRVDIGYGLEYLTNDSTLKPGDKVKIVKQ